MYSYNRDVVRLGRGHVGQRVVPGRGDGIGDGIVDSGRDAESAAVLLIIPPGADR